VHERYRAAWRRDGTAETLWETEGDGLVLLAPHGGDVEFNTDEAAAWTHKRLRARGAAPTTWLFHGFGDGAFDDYHRTSTAIGPDTYPRLSTIADRGFDHAVSFHVQAADHVGIGGAADEPRRAAVAAELEERLPGDHRIVVDREGMKHPGVDPDNVVNWITADGASGVQIELTPEIAHTRWRRVGEAVAAVYGDVLGAADPDAAGDDAGETDGNGDSGGGAAGGADPASDAGGDAG